ncbi:MAG: hypothetical protein K8R44_04840, partial [Sulfurimonas sp.]|nr:hypothetical protein [Sulfurimonas sp.]
MMLDNHLLNTNNYTIKLLDDILYVIDNLKLLKKNGNVVIHIISFSHTTELYKNLKNKLENLIPHAEITFLKHNDEINTFLTVYSLKEDITLQDFNNKILNKLYEDNLDKDNNLKEYRDRLFS